MIGAVSQPYLRNSSVSVPFSDPNYLPGIAPTFGQDLLFSGGSNARTLPYWRELNLGQTIGVRSHKINMQTLRFLFSTADNQQMSNELVREFFTARSHVVAFTRESLNSFTRKHPSFIRFRANMINEFGFAFRRAGYDLGRVGMIQNVPLPNFRRWSDKLKGTFFMVDRLAHAYTVLTGINYDPGGRSYTCNFRFLFYDVFGLDDNDVRRYGISAGVRSWWQLQHQHGYAPLVTRIVVDTSMTYLFE